MINKIIEIPEVTIPATQIELTVQDFTVFMENGEVAGVRVTLHGGAEPQHIEMKVGDERLTDEIWADLTNIIFSIISVDTNEQAAVIQKARDQVATDARKKEFDRAVTAGEITPGGLPVKK